MIPTQKPFRIVSLALEGWKLGLAFGSGLAATDTVLRLLKVRISHVLAGQ